MTMVVRQRSQYVSRTCFQEAFRDVHAEAKGLLHLRPRVGAVRIPGRAIGSTRGSERSQEGGLKSRACDRDRFRHSCGRDKRCERIRALRRANRRRTHQIRASRRSRAIAPAFGGRQANPATARQAGGTAWRRSRRAPHLPATSTHGVPDNGTTQRWTSVSRVSHVRGLDGARWIRRWRRRRRRRRRR